MNDKYTASFVSVLCSRFLSKSYKLQVKHMVVVFFILVLSVLSVSCTAKYYRDFDLVDQKYQLQPDKIVILPGTLREQDVLLASKISEYLIRESSFNVVSFEEVESKMPDYKNIMADMEIPDFKKDNTKVHYLSKKNVLNVKAVNKKFQSKYVFLVWSSSLERRITYTQNQYGQQTASDVDYEITVYGRLLDFPKSKIVGYSINEYKKSQNDGFLYGLIKFIDVTKLFRSENTEIVNFLESCSKVIGSEIIRVSNLSN